MKKCAKIFSANYRFYLCAVLLLLISCQNQPKKIMNDDPTKNNSSSAPVSLPEMEKFIFNSDVFNREVVPRKLDAGEVAKFLIEKINAETELKYWLQVEKAANFYDTYEVAEKFKAFLNKNESGEDGVRRSIVIARIVGSVGKPEDAESAKKYYPHLVSKVDSLVEFKDIILLHDVLRLGKKSEALRTKIQSKMKSLEARKDADEEAETEYFEFQGKIEKGLDRAEKTASFKEQILGMTDRKKRMEEEIKMYLGIDYGFLEYLQPWAAARLRRETWETAPAEQIVRDVKPPLRADVAKNLREFYEKLDEMPDLEEDEEKEAAQVQILRAIKFFEGEISDQEENFLAQYKGKQADILANEGFLLP